MGPVSQVRGSEGLVRAARYLERDPLVNIAAAWQLQEAQQARSGREVLWFDDGPEQGVFILAPRPAHSLLPRCWRVVLMETQEAPALAAFLAWLPARQRLCFFLQRSWFVPPVTALFAGEWFESELYHALSLQEFRAQRRWLVAQLGAEHAPLIARAEGWTRYVLANLRAPSDSAWGVIRDEQVLASCFCTELLAGVVAICAVYTNSAHRNRGLARSVVSAAAEAILAEGKTPFYCADEDNLASRRVAESVGFRPYLQHRRWVGRKGCWAMGAAGGRG